LREGFARRILQLRVQKGVLAPPFNEAVEVLNRIFKELVAGPIPRGFEAKFNARPVAAFLVDR
jgi:hypothetical protein